jgi:hypothetical protein
VALNLKGGQYINGTVPTVETYGVKPNERLKWGKLAKPCNRGTA